VTTLADVSTWADQIRVQRPETAPWHYVNIPVHPAPAEPSGYVATRDCPNEACVVAKIEQFERVLADRQASERERLEALKYLIHFIGDMHQPLHASNNNDRGGNDVTVTFMGRQTNLHAVWDSGIVEPAVKGDERGYAMQLTRNITQAEFTQWSQGNPVSWANEAHDVATSLVYGELQHAGALPGSYEAQALPVVNEQLERAGVRLAKVLNDCLR
jgi:nuclease S1